MSYQDDRPLEDEFHRSGPGDYCPYLLERAVFEYDVERATDLIACRKSIAVRFRRGSGDYAERYPRQFTIRSRRDSGAKTELSKIIDGWGDLFFYGHVSEGVVWPWYLIDLHKLRALWLRCPEAFARARQPRLWPGG